MTCTHNCEDCKPVHFDPTATPTPRIDLPDFRHIGKARLKVRKVSKLSPPQWPDGDALIGAGSGD